MASDSVLQNRVGVVTSNPLGGELVKVGGTGGQHTEYMRALVRATDEAASRHGKARRR